MFRDKGDALTVERYGDTGGAMHWKRSTTTVLAASLALAFACDDSPTEPKIAVPAVVYLKAGESQLTPFRSLRVKFVEVKSEGRCPVAVNCNCTVNCIWAGEAVVRVELRERERSVGSALLSTHPGLCRPCSSPSSTRLGGYSLELLGLDPYPTYDGSTGTDQIPKKSSYRLTLRITDR